MRKPTTLEWRILTYACQQASHGHVTAVSRFSTDLIADLCERKWLNSLVGYELVRPSNVALIYCAGIY